jgi:hypothetical protein
MQEHRITITLFESERNALFELASTERRDTRGQAAIIIRQELERRGLLLGTAGNQALKCEKPEAPNGNQ